MKNREHALYEQYLYEQAQDKKLAEEKADLMKKQAQEKEDFFAKLDRYRKQGELAKLKQVGLEEAVYNDMLGTAFKAVYISALQECGELSARAENLANSNVDEYIKENGGAKRIIREHAGKTALLDTIFEYVNESTLEEINNFNILTEAEKKAKKEKEVDDAEAVNPVKDDEANRAKQAAEEDQDDETQENPADDQAEDTEEEPVAVDDNGNPIDTPAEDDAQAEPENQDPEAEDTPEDTPADAEEAPEEQPEDDGVDVDEPLPELKDSKEDLFNKMEKEDDITAAVDLISQRVQDAEQEFIKKNAQDKKKIEKIIDKLSNRIDGATDNPTKDNAADVSQAQQDAQVAQAQQEATRLIKNTRIGYHSVFEAMVEDNAKYIMKNNVLRESYIDDGHLDMASIVESTRVMYGFLEFVNTMKLENVNESFIKNVLEDK